MVPPMRASTDTPLQQLARPTLIPSIGPVHELPLPNWFLARIPPLESS